MATHPNTAQSMGIKCMKGGGTCTSVQPYITGSRAVFSKILTKSHDILQVYEPEGPPCLSRTVKRGSNIEDRESGSEDRGSWIEDRELRIQNGELRIENRELGIEKRGSRIEDRESRMGLVKPGREIDENGRQVQNRVEVSMFKYFLLLPNDSASFLRKLNATNFKASWKEIRSRVQLSCF